MPITFDPFVVGLVVLAALMHASWNALVKTGGDGLLMFVLLKAPTMAIGVVVLAVAGLPNAASIPLGRQAYGPMRQRHGAPPRSGGERHTVGVIHSIPNTSLDTSR